jgi:hypothetical protein
MLLNYSDFSSSFTFILFIDASTSQTMENSFKTFSQVKGVGDTPQQALQWLASHNEAWVLLFDNADDPKVAISPFFPACRHGNILITTRNADLKRRGSGQNSSYYVQSMLPEDGRSALLKAAQINVLDLIEIKNANTLAKVISLFSIRMTNIKLCISRSLVLCPWH